jgi:hypothetical protein
MKVEFYNVKKKTKVQVDRDRVSKHAYEKASKMGSLVIRYALKAVDEDGTKLSKFCSKADYDSI